MHAAPSTSQSGEASSSTGYPLEPQAFYSHGPVGSTASSRDPENALQKAYEKAIRSQIEVIYEYHFL
jgi:E3 ubiquitin-protein ligase synoviolin